MQPQIGDILHTEEIKQIIAKITPFDIVDYGSKMYYYEYLVGSNKMRICNN
jgi:hypothetical protein